MQDFFENVLGCSFVGLSCIVQIGLFLIGCAFVLWFFGLL